MLRKLCLLCVALFCAIGLFGCAGTDTESASLNLVVQSPTEAISSILFDVVCGDGAVFSDELLGIPDTDPPSFGGVLDLPAGTCDAVFTALDAAQQPICLAAATFPVEAGELLDPVLMLDCPDAAPAAGEAPAGDDRVASQDVDTTVDQDINLEQDVDTTLDQDVETNLEQDVSVEQDVETNLQQEVVTELNQDVNTTICNAVVVAVRNLGGIGLGVLTDAGQGDIDISFEAPEMCVTRAGDDMGADAAATGAAN